jgi:ABC-2 type transport system permease protein
MRKVLFIIQKELRQILRDRSYLMFIVAAPLFQLILMGYALSTEVRHVPVAVLDEDHSSSSRAILDAFQAGSLFAFKGMAGSTGEATLLLDNGKVKLVIVIPPHFQRDMRNGRLPQVQTLVDGVDGNTAGIALAYAGAALAQVQQRQLREASTGPVSAGLGSVTLVPRMWYNPNLDSKLNIVPVLIAVLLISITTFLMAVNIVKEKELGTYEQLMVTPVSSLQLIIGKVIPFTILGFIQITIGVAIAVLVFGIWMKGSILLFYAMAMVFCLSTLGIGIFASTLATTQRQAIFVVQFFLNFATLLSGVFTPIDNMPLVIQYITYANPLRYFFVILREIYLKGTGLQFYWKEAVAMGAIGLVMFAAATARFQKRLR